MFPIIFRIGHFALHTYGLMAAVAVLTGLQVLLHVYRQSAEYNKSLEEALQQMFLFSLLCGIIFARLFYVVVFWRYFAGNPLDILKIWQGGLIFYGGFLGAFLGLVGWNLHYKQFSLLKVLDWASPALAFGHALGRLGCFFAGCCYGKETKNSWGIVFTSPESLAPQYVYLYPTQLFEMTFLLILGKFLLMRIKKYRQDPSYIAGKIFSEYLLIYALGRWGIELFRADPAWIFGWSAGQVAALVVFVGAAIFRVML